VALQVVAPVAPRVVVLVWGDLAAAMEAAQGLVVEATAKGCSVLEATVTAIAGMEGAAMGTAETMEEETAATKAMAAVVMVACQATVVAVLEEAAFPAMVLLGAVGPRAAGRLGATTASAVLVVLLVASKAMVTAAPDTPHRCPVVPSQSSSRDHSARWDLLRIALPAARGKTTAR